MTRLQTPPDIRWVGTQRPQNSGYPIETTYFKTVFELTSPVDLPREQKFHTFSEIVTDAAVVRTHVCDNMFVKTYGQVLIHISANSRYILYVNGHEITHGPCRGDHWHQFVDHVDIAPYLQPGTNIVAAKVTSFPPYETTHDDLSNLGHIWCMSNAAGPMLLVWGELTEYDKVDISTGRANWVCQNDTAITTNHQWTAHWMGSMEEVDGAKLPHGWQTRTDDKWQTALPKWTTQPNHYGDIPRLFPYKRPIKPLLRISNDNFCQGDSIFASIPSYGREHELPPLKPNTTQELILDTGQLTTSFVYLHCKGGMGSKIELHYAECFYQRDENDNLFKHRRNNGELVTIYDIYHPGGNPDIVQVFSPSWLRTFRYIKMVIHTADEPLSIYPLQLIETRYPLENKVTFNAPQKWVHDVWGMSLRTQELCMHESYEDCPYYEQLQYTMDTRLQILNTYAIDGELDLPRKTLHDFHTSMLPEGILLCRYPTRLPAVIPGFSLHWIFMLRDYYWQTADTKLIERYRPTMEAILAWFKRHGNEDGLVQDMPYWNYADWAAQWSDIAGTPRAALYGPSTIHNLTYAYTLGVAAELLQAIGHNEIALMYAREKTNILDAIDNYCWDEPRGLYREGPNYTGEYTQHAQVWAVLCGLATGERARRILQTAILDHTLIPCSFAMQFYLFRALEVAGMYNKTEQLWQLWRGLLTLDLSTIPEVPSKYTRSDCHAWGALLLYELPSKFLGVEPLEPGYKHISIRPQALFMEAMEGTVPTPHGPVYVKWSYNGGMFTIEGSTPVPTTITLPSGSKYNVDAGTFTFGT